MLRDVSEKNTEVYKHQKQELVNKLSIISTQVREELDILFFELDQREEVYEPYADIENICSICGVANEFESKICVRCGCDLSKSDFEMRDFVEAYNNRLEQYRKNSLFEYDVIKVHNEPTGASDIEVIKKELVNHSINGWRLHTIYSNELGKNAIVGINATACEDILVFERCIKY